MSARSNAVWVTMPDSDNDRADDCLGVTSAVPLHVADDDIEPPLVGSGTPVNLLRNAGFEIEGSDANRFSGETNYFSHPGETWTYVSLQATAPVGCAFAQWEAGTWGMNNQGALQFDDVTLGPIMDTAMAVQIVPLARRHGHHQHDHHHQCPAPRQGMLPRYACSALMTEAVNPRELLCAAKRKKNFVAMLAVCATNSALHFKAT